MTLLVDEQPLSVIPTLAKQIGLHESIILQQIHCWLAVPENISFFYGLFWLNSVHERCISCFHMWDKRKIQHLLQLLEDQDYLIFLHKGKSGQDYVTIDYSVLPIAQPYQFTDSSIDSLSDQSLIR